MQSRLARGALWTFLGVGGSRAVMLLVSVASARLLGRDPYGQLGMVRSSVSMLTAIASFGMGLTASKHVAQYWRSDPQRAGRIIRLSLITATLAGAVGAACLWLGARGLALRLESPELAPLLASAAALVVLECVQGAQAGSLAGLEAFKSIARINVLVSLLSAPLIVFGAWRAGAAGAVIGMTASVAMNVLLSGWAIRHQAGARRLPRRPRGCAREWRVLLGFSLPAALCGCLVAPVEWLCCTMLVRASGGFAQFGIYTAASQWKIALLLVARHLGSVSLPLLSSLHAEGDGRQFAKLLKTNCLIVGALTSAAAAPLALAAPWIMRAYGAEFAGGAATLMLLASAAMAMALSYSIGQAWLAMGRVWTRLCLHLIWAAVTFLSASVYLRWRADSAALAAAALTGFVVHLLLQVTCLGRAMRTGTPATARGDRRLAASQESTLDPAPQPPAAAPQPPAAAPQPPAADPQPPAADPQPPGGYTPTFRERSP